MRPILRVLEPYGLAEVEQVHWHRMLRAVMFGFAAHEEAGGFTHYPVSSDESYRHAIECIAAGLHAAGEARA